MELSFGTGFQHIEGKPLNALRLIAEAGFSHIHWCHHRHDDFIYVGAELDQIARWCRESNLRVLGIHASYGREKRYASALEYQRLAGVELLKNRVQMAYRLECDTIVLHLPDPGSVDVRGDWTTASCRSFDDVLPYAQKHGVRIAVENGDFEKIKTILSLYGPEVMGLCYDSGHGNIGSAYGLNHLQEWKDRLIALHLHDNDGTADQHRPLFSGTVDWERLADILAESSYDKCMSLEQGFERPGHDDVSMFLSEAHRTGARFSEMVSARRGGAEARDAAEVPPPRSQL
jgi:sugar phosphate isomerase/epimerase